MMNDESPRGGHSRYCASCIHHSSFILSPPMQTPHELVVEPVGLDVEALPRPVDWAALFGNENPVELEIGAGKGTFLTEQARARPGVNFFGIEWARWYWRYASDRLRRSGCANARTV